MLLDQEAGDLVGAASFGKSANYVEADEWVAWRRYLLPVPHILVPDTFEEKLVVIPDSLPFCSRRTVSRIPAR